MKHNAVEMDPDGNGRIKIRGSQDHDYRGLACKRLRVRSSGSADTTLEGTVTELEIEVSGSSTIDARDLKADVVVVDICGSARIYAHADKEFRIDAADSTRVYLYGRGDLTFSRVTGSANIHRRPRTEGVIA